MTVEAITGMTAVAVARGRATEAAIPNAQQVARFEGQLQEARSNLSVGHYTPPVGPLDVSSTTLHPVVSYAGQISEALRTQLNSASLEADLSGLDPQQAAAVQSFEQSCRMMCQFGATTLHFQFFTKGVQITNDSARVLLQQA
jgi:hypothetical protein